LGCSCSLQQGKSRDSSILVTVALKAFHKMQVKPHLLGFCPGYGTTAPICRCKLWGPSKLSCQPAPSAGQVA
jgi:hypothetical protein